MFEFLPALARSDVVEFVEAEPLREGKSEARVASRRARDSLIRAEADAISGLFFRAFEMRRESVGSSKRLHHRERSRVAEATGKWTEFFHCGGKENSACERSGVTPQLLKLMSAALRNRKNRAECTEKLMMNWAGTPSEEMKFEKFQNKISASYVASRRKLTHPTD